MEGHHSDEGLHQWVSAWVHYLPETKSYIYNMRTSLLIYVYNYSIQDDEIKAYSIHACMYMQRLHLISPYRNHNYIYKYKQSSLANVMIIVYKEDLYTAHPN